MSRRSRRNQPAREGRRTIGVKLEGELHEFCTRRARGLAWSRSAFIAHALGVYRAHLEGKDADAQVPEAEAPKAEGAEAAATFEAEGAVVEWSAVRKRAGSKRALARAAEARTEAEEPAAHSWPPGYGQGEEADQSVDAAAPAGG